MEIAKREIGPNATPVDWVVQKVAYGVTIGTIAKELAAEMGESVSRNFLSGHINNATPGAKERIQAAREEATHVWAEQALEIAERPAITTAEVQQARLQFETRRWLTAVVNREEFSEKQQHEVTLDLGQLHLAAPALELPNALSSRPCPSKLCGQLLSRRFSVRANLGTGELVICSAVVTRPVAIWALAGRGVPRHLGSKVPGPICSQRQCGTGPQLAQVQEGAAQTTRKAHPGVAMSLRSIKAVISFIALGVIVARMVWPGLHIDAITLGLLLLAALPWLSPLIKSAELPGGWKIEFQDLREAAEKITSKAPGASAGTGRLQVAGHAPTVVVGGPDPNIALVSVRIEIEKRLRALARAAGIDPDQSLSRLARALHQKGVLDDSELAGLQDLIAAGNRAAHGAPVSPDVSAWVRNYAGEVLDALDAKLPP